MNPSQNHLRSSDLPGLVSYLNYLSPKLAELTAPLKALSKRDTVYTWESSQQAAFEIIQKELILTNPSQAS